MIQDSKNAERFPVKSLLLTPTPSLPGSQTCLTSTRAIILYLTQVPFGFYKRRQTYSLISPPPCYTQNAPTLCTGLPFSYLPYNCLGYLGALPHHEHVSLSFTVA